MSRSYASIQPLRSVTQWERDKGLLPDEPVIPVKLVAHEFTPGQQLALLWLRKSDLSKSVHAKLMHSTARATPHDYDALAGMGYAHRRADGWHKLTPRGHFKANELARELALEFKISIAGFQSLAQQKSRFGSRWNGMAHGENG